GQVDHSRRGQIFSNWAQAPQHIAVDDEDFRFVELKSDWEFEISDQFMMKYGFDVRGVWADYDYQSREYFYGYFYEPESTYVGLNDADTFSTQFEKSGTKLCTYLSNRFRLAESLAAELGLRYDHTSYAGDDLLSPRVNLVYDLNDKTTIRGGWGYYYQTQEIHEISAGDGETEFYPAQKAEHRVIGLEHEHSSGIRLRLEAYYKQYDHLRP
ncbi:MAG: TonB-dependent receptor, partial [Planctomycetes bacterium]|nr:TonB-dependent receptor [Planctomycetota bacterium]